MEASKSNAFALLSVPNWVILLRHLVGMVWMGKRRREDAVSEVLRSSLMKGRSSRRICPALCQLRSHTRSPPWRVVRGAPSGPEPSARLGRAFFCRLRPGGSGASGGRHLESWRRQDTRTQHESVDEAVMRLAHLTHAAVHGRRGEGCGQRCGALPTAAPVLALQLLLIR